MPPVDLISVCAGDSRVACETTLTTTTTTTTTLDNDNDNGNDNDNDDSPTLEPETQQSQYLDYAPQSFWLSKDAELDWLDRNAFLDRNDSVKGSSNPNPVHVYVGSQRYSVNLKSKASLIALPKSQKLNYAEVKNRRYIRPPSKRLFPKLSEPVQGKSGLGFYEPGSPKVSCIGRVRSRKERSQRGNNTRKKVSEPGLIRVKSVKERKKSGFWKNVRTIFRSKGIKLNQKEGKQQEDFIDDVVKRSSSLKKRRGFNSSRKNKNNMSNGSSDITPVEPPGLGAIKRFASGRKSDAWAGDVEVNSVMSEPLDHVGPIWRRREVGPRVHISVDRDWRKVGPVSV